MLLLRIGHLNGVTQEEHMGKKDLPYAIGIGLLNILAPIFLMPELVRTTPAHASLLNNFKIVATSLIAIFSALWYSKVVQNPVLLHRRVVFPPVFMQHPKD